MTVPRAPRACAMEGGCRGTLSGETALNIQSAQAGSDQAAGTRAPLSARISWMLFDWSVQPFYTLILTFLFAPYFANVVVGDGARGQAMWGFAAAIAGVLIAVGSPFLGALADGRGQRKPWIALFSVVLAAAMTTLWIATPAAPMPTIYVVLIAFVVATACAEYTAVFTNAIMPSLVPKSEVGRLSGAGWACGYFGGLASLALVAGFLVPAGDTGTTLLGTQPLLGLDTARAKATASSGRSPPSGTSCS